MLALAVLPFLSLASVSHVFCESETLLEKRFGHDKPTPAVWKLLHSYKSKQHGTEHMYLVTSHTQDICLTEGCVLTAADVLRHMNKDVDPCDDFYEFACGNYIKHTKIPGDQGEIDEFSTVSDKVKEQLRILLEEPSATNEAKPFRLAKDLYKACMDTGELEEVVLNNIKDIVHRMGGWPVLDGDQWDASKFTWTDTVYKLRDEGFDFDDLFSFQVGFDLKMFTRKIIILNQKNPEYVDAIEEAGIKNAKTEDKHKKLVDAIYNITLNLATMFGADRGRAIKELNETLAFKNELISILSLGSPISELNAGNCSSEDSTDCSNLTVVKLQEEYPSIPWAEYISTTAPVGGRVHPKDVVVMYEPAHIEKLVNLLRTTPKRTQANYLVWFAMFSIKDLLPESLRRGLQEYRALLLGTTEPIPRWMQCVDEVYKRLRLAVDSLYVQRFFKKEVKNSASDMVNSIKEELYKILQTVDWLDGDTREKALEKARATTSIVAYPDELLQIKNLEDIYQKIEIRREKYLETILKLDKFNSNLQFKARHGLDNRTQLILFHGAAIYGAFYWINNNSIDIPAALLQDPFFFIDRPNYMNYAAAGYVIGHEIIHGFDNQGRKYDSNGDLKEWWDPETAKVYLKKVQCIIDQYGNYTDEQTGLTLDGVSTQGENIADNGGIKLAYRAYNHWVAEHGTEKRLPGLQDFTPLQMFWISAANIWCSKSRLKTKEYQIKSDEHSPREFRVRGPLSNSPEFSKDFNCPAGSKMNPPNKCDVW